MDLCIYHIGTGVEETLVTNDEMLIMNSPRFSPDNNIIAFVGEGYIEEPSNGIFIYSLQTDELIPIYETNISNWLDLSPEGDWIAFSQGDDLFKMNVEGEDRIKLWDASNIDNVSNILGLTWSNDGEYIFAGIRYYTEKKNVEWDDHGGVYNYHYCVIMIRADGSGEYSIILDDTEYATNPEYGEVEGILYFTSEYDGYIKRLNLDTEEVNSLISGEKPAIYSGGYIIYFIRNGNIWRYRLYN